MTFTDIKSLDNFYAFSRRNKCFIDDNIVSQRLVTYKDVKFHFTLINTAIFSVLGSSNKDKGLHYLSKEDIEKIIPKTKYDLNIVVMHHGSEWFNDNVKESLESVFLRGISIIFKGHEHNGFGENQMINNRGSIISVQGNSISGDKHHIKGFVSLIYDSEDRNIKGYSFIWNKDYYKPSLILDQLIQEKTIHNFTNCRTFSKYLLFDDNNNLIEKYFVFPTISYNFLNSEDEVETEYVDDFECFFKFIEKNDKTIITGDTKTGKSTLAKLLFKFILDNDDGIIPLLFVSENLQSKKINKLVEYAFKDQYEDYDDSYDKYMQLDKEQRILIIDGGSKIIKSKLEVILQHYDLFFDKIIIFSDEKVEINIEKKVIENLAEEKVGQLLIKHFLYDKRKMLISKVLELHSTDRNDNNQQTTNEINKLISDQVKYFQLNPEFIIDFVVQFKMNNSVTFTPGTNIFSIVYENSIRNKIINNTNPGDVNGVISVIEEMAYYMHFKKKDSIIDSEMVSIIERYNTEFRQNVKFRNFLDVTENSKILVDENNTIRFKDNNQLAYFVARALNKKYHFEIYEEEINQNLEYVLNNLCFGINSDIILFMALITNNPKVIGLIINSSHDHFNKFEELNFDKNNIPYLCDSNFTVKDTIPDNQEKKERDKSISKYEEEIKASELVELVNNYDYDESDIDKIENQVLKSIKYLEVLAKILPSFSHNMLANQQDELVKVIYSYTNKFLYLVLGQISDNYADFIESLYTDISELRKEKNISEINIQSVKTFVELMSVVMIINLYQFVSSTASNKQTIPSLNAFNYSANSNYSILNLMMVEKTGNIHEFHNKAVKLNENSDNKLIKSLVKYSVRNFFLYNDVKLIGEGQALIDKFFGSSDKYNLNKKRIKQERIKNKFKIK